MHIQTSEESVSTFKLSLSDMYGLGVKILTRSGVSEENAGHVATALSVAEADGLASHGMSRLPAYSAQARSGKVDGRAAPVFTEGAKAVLRVNVNNGFAYAALTMSINRLVTLAHDYGIASACFTNSHHCGALGYHVERLAEQGMVGLMVANTPAAIAPWGGSRAVFGTNPIALAAPRGGGTPLVIDLSLSVAARGKIMVAAQKGEAIPEGWALDAAGRPTTDAAAALKGTMLPMGDAKGSALAMMVEIIAAAMTGANFGFEASSFFDAEGTPPRVGQMLIAFDPAATNDVFTGNMLSPRLETLISSIKTQPDTHIPGEHRANKRREARLNGVEIPEELHRELLILAGGA